MSKVLVTGGGGFIGSAIVDVLLGGRHEVHVVDNLSLGRNHWEGLQRAPQFHVADVLDLERLAQLFERIGPEMVLHLAAHHYIPFCEANPHEAYRLNVQGTLNVLELCRRHAVRRFFFASTGDVYPPSFAPHKEVDTVCPIYTYGLTKLLGEQICADYFKKHMTQSAALIGRIFNAAGPRETNPHLIPEVVKQIVAGKKTIEVGNLWPRRDFVDVRSMAEVIVALTVKATGVEVVNIGSGIAQDIGEVLGTLTSVVPDRIEVISSPARQRPNDRAYLCPDVGRLTRMNGAPAQPFGLETARRIFEEHGIL